MRQSFKTEGFVLKKTVLLNRDLVITIFTESLGLIRVFAHGIRKITSRRSPHIETGNLIKAVIYKKNDKFYLQETILESGFYNIKEDKDKLKAFYIFLFVLEHLIPENENEKKIFSLFKLFLISLSKGKDTQVITNRYLNQVIKSLGYIEKELSPEEINPFIEDLINEKLPKFDI